MSSNLTIRALMEAPNVGGQVARVESTRVMPIPLAESWNNPVLMVEGNANGVVTLWDVAQSSNPGTWQAMGIYVDPDQENVIALASPGQLALKIEIQVQATVLVFSVEPMAPLLFTNQAADVILQATQPPPQLINRVRCRNDNPVTAGPAGQNNLKVLLKLFN